MWLFLSACRCGTSGRKLTCTHSLATPTPWLQSDVRLQNRKSSPVNKSYTKNQTNLAVWSVDDINSLLIWPFHRKPRFNHQAVGFGCGENQSNSYKPQEVSTNCCAAPQTVSDLHYLRTEWAVLLVSANVLPTH